MGYQQLKREKWAIVRTAEESTAQELETTKRKGS